MKKVKYIMLALTILTSLCFIACLVVWIITAINNTLNPMYIVASIVTFSAMVASWIAFVLLLKELKKPTQLTIFDDEEKQN